MFTAFACLPPAIANAASSPTVANTTLFRIFLHDGTPLVSYGEFAHVGDRVIFSMPVGESGATPALQLVQIPASAVDWRRTDQYADSIRYQHYVATRANADYAALTSTVAAAVNSIAHASDAAASLKTAEAIRGTVVDWPRSHFGYRADDVRQILELLDQTIASLKASTGAQHFNLSLVAGIAPPPVEPVLPVPTPQEAIAQVLTVARLSEAPAQRVSLLTAALSQLDAAHASVPGTWLKATRHDTEHLLDQERRWTRNYQGLVKSALDDAQSRAEDADVRGVQAVLERVRRRDADWGRHRPDEIAALMTALDARLESARTRRLALDRWKLRAPVLAAYHDQVERVLTMLNRARPSLEAIRSLAGPDADALKPLEERLATATRRLTILDVPAEMQSAQALLMSAARLGEQAAAVRLQATLSGQLDRAWDASSAAAGSLMLVDRARHELETQLKPPAHR
ncbi:MAG TPA: hypothetical protein VIC33_03035 [Vicinamibacterales bacterium]